MQAYKKIKTRLFNPTVASKAPLNPAHTDLTRLTGKGTPIATLGGAFVTLADIMAQERKMKRKRREKKK